MSREISRRRFLIASTLAASYEVLGASQPDSAGVRWAKNEGTPVSELVTRYPTTHIHTTKKGTEVVQYADPSNAYFKIVYNLKGGSIRDGVEWLFRECDGHVDPEMYLRQNGYLVGPKVRFIPEIESVIFHPHDTKLPVAAYHFIQYDPTYEPNSEHEVRILRTYPPAFQNPYDREEEIGAAFVVSALVAPNCSVLPRDRK